jgi:hypothetical protein
VFSIKALAVVTAVSAGVVFAMPVASQAIPQTSPLKVDKATNTNIVKVRHRYQRWARYCRYHMGDYRCNHGRQYSRYNRYRYYDDGYYGNRYYDDGYYGNRYYGDPYYGHYRNRGPGIGLGPLRFGF